MDYGLKVSKPGFDVKTAADKDLVFSSKYFTPRVLVQGSGAITHTGGRTVTIAHNLGYVPMYLVHGDISGVPTVLPSGAYGPLPFTVNYSIGASIKPDQNVLTWADEDNIYIKVGPDFGYSYYTPNDVAEEDALGYARYYFGYGHNFDIFGDMNGAIRFGSVVVDRYATVYDASIGIKVTTRWGSDNMYIYMTGIDEDNTGDFSSNPFGRSQTSAQARPEANPSAGSTMWFGCKDQLQEVVNRSGWNSGNNFALMFRDDGPDGESPSGNGIFGSSGHYLKVLTINTLLNYKYTIFRDKII